MFLFLLGVSTTIIIFILILYHLHQFSTDSEYRKLIDEKNVFNLQQKNDKEHETFKREMTLKDETIHWVNALFTQIFTHFRGNSDNSDIDILNKTISDSLPPGYTFKLDTIGENIIFNKPRLFYIQESNANPTISNSTEDKEILQINVPVIYNGLSFTIFSQIDGKNKDKSPIKIPLFEFDFRRVEANVCALFSLENPSETEIQDNNIFSLNVSFEIENESNILDFDSSLIVNNKKYTFTNCPIFGIFFKALLQYFIIKRKFNFLISSSDINFNVVRNFIENHNIIRTEMNLM